MKRERWLTLRAERLAELTSDELRGVAGGDVTEGCLTRIRECQPSNYAASLCGCLTDYCVRPA